MAYYDQYEVVVDSRTRIAYTYLKGWFIVDTISILPISYFFNIDNYSSLARMTRLPKLYRLVKLFK